MFSLQNQNAKLVNLNVRAEKHGDEKKLTADLKFTIKVPNDVLSEFDPSLKSALYKKADEPQGELIDDVNYLPALKFPEMSGIGWGAEYNDYSIIIHNGIGGKSDIKLIDCPVDKFRFAPMDGGSVEVTFRVIVHPETTELAKICQFISSEVEITLIEPDYSAQNANKQADLEN